MPYCRLSLCSINGKYASPELLEGDEKVTPKSDDFQLGIMLYELLNKKTLKNYFRHADAACKLGRAEDSEACLGCVKDPHQSHSVHHFDILPHHPYTTDTL